MEVLCDVRWCCDDGVVRCGFVGMSSWAVCESVQGSRDLWCRWLDRGVRLVKFVVIGECFDSLKFSHGP